MSEVVPRVKYPRTRHLPGSPGRTPDDVGLADLSALAAGEVVVTEKMDGENTTIGRGYSHARSVDSGPHPSRSWMRRLAAQLAPDLPDDLRICGENLYARHSLGYTDLASYLLVFGVWRGDECLSWDDTVEWAELLGLTTVPVLYRGPWTSEADLLRRWRAQRAEGESEGLVVRTARGFSRAEFADHVGKWVRAGHVTTSEHWAHGAVVPNGLRRG